MDLLKMHKRRSRLSEAAYIVLNIALAVTLIIIVRAAQSLWLAIVVILLSKWRVFAVRPRFWFANLVANLVDVIVGVSTVVLLYAANGTEWLQAALTLLYIGWLLFIKPRSRRSYMAIQAGIAVFLGVTALSIVSYTWDVSLFVIGMWGIGYVVTRHVLGSYEEPHTTLYSLVGGVIAAELGWIGFHWLMAYRLAGFGDIQFSQLAVFTTLFCLIAERAYASNHKYGHIRRADLILPVVLTISIMAVMYSFAIFFGTTAL